MSRWVEHDLFGGRGKVTVELALEKTPPRFEVVLRCALAPGGSVGFHQQEHCDEVVVVLAGSGLAELRPEATVRLKPGVVVPVPLGVQLSLRNTSRRASLRYLIIKAAP